MTGLKTLVISMGFLIVVGIALVGYGLTRARRSEPPVPIQTGAPAALGFFASDVPVPQGSKLAGVSATGDRLVLHFTGADGDKIVVLDAHSGQVTGSVTLVPDKN
jgi:hypothetical protein